MAEDVGASGAQTFDDGRHFVGFGKVTRSGAIHIGDNEPVTIFTQATENGFPQTAGSPGPCAYSDLFFCHQIFSFV
ncbi:MAG: Uncharacterised protein [Halieaceae bacterium]|nr:MAG: Uncharacterised protein [Halieaceae bacterium]